jgi:hypothetical protein
MDRHDIDQPTRHGDGQTLRPSATVGTPDRPLHIYRLIPVAADDDPNWLGATEHDEISVCAQSPADARIVAADRELDFLEVDAAPAEDVTTVNASMYRNEKLYTVVDDGKAAPGLERGVVDGVVRVDNILPTQTE